MKLKWLVLTVLMGGAAFFHAMAEDLAPLPLVLPEPAARGTPQNLPTNTTAAPLTSQMPPAFYAPKGVTNVALNKPVSASDTNLINGELPQVTDGKKGASDENIVTLRRGLQWVQVDLKGQFKLYAIVLWHDFAAPVVYRDVIVQISNDPDFKTGVRTIFNNDQKNSAGFGIGTDREYFDNPLTAAGKTIDAKGIEARYIRCYSRGSTQNALNNYIEVEAYGLPAS